MVAEPLHPRLLITAGPTHEPIDAVRYLANRSSGKLGVALAEAARDAGWDVTLLMGPADVALPADVTVRRFVTTEDLQRLLADCFPQCDVLVMAAAVADYRPQQRTTGKLCRGEGGLRLELESTPDLVAGCAASKRPDQRVVAFALEETEKLGTRAVQKMEKKRVDAIIANPVETMSSETIDATLIYADGRRVQAGSRVKGEFARWLVERLKSWDTGV